MFSKRTAVNRQPNSLALTCERLRAAGAPLLDLTQSNPTRCDLPYAREEILRALGDPRGLEYEPAPSGLLASRRALLDLTQPVRLEPRQVVLTASTSEAYGFLFKLLCDPGDVVLAPQPSYPLFEHLALLEEVRLRPYRLEYDGAWHIDLDSVREALSPRTRAILLVSPNNPTGNYLKRSELDSLTDLGLPLICDEVFADYPLAEAPPATAVSALSAREGLVFTLGGLSKLAALPQLKLGWIFLGGAARLWQEALARLELITDTYLSVSTPVQHALPRLLELRAKTSDALRARLRDNLEALRLACAHTAVTPLFVEGGWYANLRLPAVRSEESWVLELLDVEGVLVQPGWFYDFASEPFFVISLLTPQPVFAAGVRRLVEFVRRTLG